MGVLVIHSTAQNTKPKHNPRALVVSHTKTTKQLIDFLCAYEPYSHYTVQEWTKNTELEHYIIRVKPHLTGQNNAELTMET